MEGTTGESMTSTPYDDAVDIVDIIAEVWRQFVKRENDLYATWVEEQAEKSEN